MSKTTYYQSNREVILNRANNFYEKKKRIFKREQKINTENYLKKKNI